MYLKNLEIKNFGPFKDINKLEFDKDFGVIFVCGEYTENKQRSNRCGKTSFVEAILYLLYGQTRDKEVNLIHNNEDEMYVAGTVCINDKDIYIKRGRTKANKPLLEIEGIKGKKTEKEKELLNVIGISYSDFINSFYFKQGDIHQFMKASPTEKKKLLQTWFNLNSWNNYEVLAKTKYNENQVIVTKSEILLKSKRDSLVSLVIPDENKITELLNYNKSQLNVCNNELFALKTQISQIVDDSNIKNSLKNLKIDFNNSIVNIDNITSNLSNIKSKKEQAQQNIDKAKGIVISTSSTLLEQKLFNIKSKLLDIQSKISSLEISFNEKRTLCQKVDTFNGVCPVDNCSCDKGNRIPNYKQQLLDEINKIAQDFSVLKNERENLDKDILLVTNEYTNSKNQENLLKNLLSIDPSSFEENINSLNSNLQISLSNKINLETQILKLEEDLKLLNPEQKLKLELQYKQKLEQINHYEEEIKKATIELGKIQQLKIQKIQLEQEIKELELTLETQKHTLYRWGYIVSIFGKDGIPSILIENSLSYIEEFANILLESVSTGYKVEFSTTREVSSKETHCSICNSPFGAESKCNVCGLGFKKKKIKDEIDLKIFNGLHERNFDLDSGGGQILISLCLRLALAKLIINKSVPCQLLILDEILGQLDIVNRDLVCKLIFSTLRNLLGISQVFVISHTNINDYPCNTIKIIRDESQNFSKIVLSNNINKL